ncbi:hypothetical protein PVAND_003001 [Polypedilum vanderplanki]|uniref:RING-type E3 ubiquitin transferase n=1 Tax=Polypedilum vanderplanki TaxID=319348 RepID=A0A9J6BSQ0_POLVA|nr:hypothetical protein PVAND_003001 [Polypedilum vanderplanki]
MGAIFSRLNDQLNNNAVEETEIVHNYKYPPKTGNFFSSSFIMGGERFDQASPESYLFGENSDLNWLSSKPTAFPYQPPKNSDPTKTLKSFINIRKESVKFVKSDTGKGYNIEFVFDSDMKCNIKIYYFSTEEVTSNSISYISKDPELVSETYNYEKGASQIFSQPSHIFYPNKFQDEDLLYDSEKDIYPVVIHCCIDEPSFDSTFTHSHTTICVVDHHSSDGEYHLRAMKQKIFVDGLCYLLQEIYGIENKNLTRVTNNDDDEDTGSECVICICEPRDTLILPCKHLCLCNSCADSLRYQANNCPICRSPFRALLQIRAVQKSNTPIININQQDGSENIPIGFMPVSLIEALNGPIHKRNSIDRKETSFNAVSEKDQKSNSVETFKMIEKCNNADVTSHLSSDENYVDNKKSTTSLKEKKGITKSLSLRDRDCVKYVNERSASINDLDDDSEAEKLSPLLVVAKPSKNSQENNSSDHAIEEKSVDKGEDSDYYTPEDTEDNAHTILSPVKSKNIEKKETRTPLTHVKETDLPDSPLSANSQLSTKSGSSYNSSSSASSTRQLLSCNINDGTANVKSNENSTKN